MPATLYLHIGASKTGTTYLQQALQANADALAAQGVLFPGRWLGHFRFTAHALDQHDLLPRPEVATQAAANLASQIHAWLEDGESRSAVLSHELLAAATDEQIARLLARFPEARVKVVYTVRALSRTLPAEWQQALKGGSTMSMRDYVSGVMDGYQSPGPNQPVVVGESEIVPKFAALHDVTRVLPRWAAHVGSAEVCVVTVPRAGQDLGELWRRFLAPMGLDASHLPVPELARPNVSLGAAEAEVLRRVNVAVRSLRGQPDFKVERRTRLLALETLVGRPNALPIVLPPEACAWAEQRSREIVAHLEASDYRVVGDLKDLLVTMPPVSGSWPEELDEALLGEVAVATLATLLLQTASPGG